MKALIIHNNQDAEFIGHVKDELLRLSPRVVPEELNLCGVTTVTEFEHKVRTKDAQVVIFFYFKSTFPFLAAAAQHAQSASATLFVLTNRVADHQKELRAAQEKHTATFVVDELFLITRSAEQKRGIATQIGEFTQQAWYGVYKVACSDKVELTPVRQRYTA